MTESINIISKEETLKKLWDQFWRLQDALQETQHILTAFGVTEFPELKDDRSSWEQGRSAPSFLSALREPSEEIVAPTTPTSSLAPRIRTLPVFRRRPEPPSLSLMEIVREACKALKTEITKDKVLAWITSQYPGRDVNNASVGTMLSAHLTNEGLLRQVQRGTGGTQSVYELSDEWA